LTSFVEDGRSLCPLFPVHVSVRQDNHNKHSKTYKQKYAQIIDRKVISCVQPKWGAHSYSVKSSQKEHVAEQGKLAHLTQSMLAEKGRVFGAVHRSSKAS
jgi:hypothetical protein